MKTSKKKKKPRKNKNKFPKKIVYFDSNEDEDSDIDQETAFIARGYNDDLDKILQNNDLVISF